MNTVNPRALAQTLSREQDHALLFRTLATLRTGIPLFADVEELEWPGPKPEFDALGKRLDAAVIGHKRKNRPPGESRIP